MKPAGKRLHWVWLKTAGTPSPDGDGSYTIPPVALSPPGAWAAVQPVIGNFAVGRQEGLIAGTQTSTASHVVTIPFHPGVSTETVVTLGTRQLNVVGVANPDEGNEDSILSCVEQT